jgi:hypothetical protein
MFGVTVLAFSLIAIFAVTTQAKDPDAKEKKKTSKKEKAVVHRDWGRRKSETDAAYKKRRDGMLQRCKKDALDLFSVKNANFLVRTDIGADFTVDLALYIEELHRAYQAAFSKLGAPPSRLKDLIEVVCYRDRKSYMDDGGPAGAGGHFDPVAGFRPDRKRPKNWPAGQFLLALFTNGEENFDKWDKSVMKHEAAHMELQFRLGYLSLNAPRWWNEGMAACFEYWDFDKGVEENFALITKRGRYAPFVRRLWGTPRWKDFNYIWTIDGAAWHRDMGNIQGYLNYCQAWSLASFMFTQGTEGKKFFNKIFTLSISLGEDRANKLGVKKRGWEEAFPLSDRLDLQKAWVGWVEKSFPKSARNDDESEHLLKMGYDPKSDTFVRASGDDEEDGDSPKSGESKKSAKPIAKKKPKSVEKKKEKDEDSDD